MTTHPDGIGNFEHGFIPHESNKTLGHEGCVKIIEDLKAQLMAKQDGACLDHVIQLKEAKDRIAHLETLLGVARDRLNRIYDSLELDKINIWAHEALEKIKGEGKG